MCKLILTINCQNNQLLTYLFSLSEILTFNEPPGNMVYVKKKKSQTGAETSTKTRWSAVMTHGPVHVCS